MATTTTGHPGRTLIVLAVLVAGLITLMAVGGVWLPKLGLDLRGGTTITLTAQNTSGTGAIDPNSLQQAKTIIQNRVDSLGVGESEVTTAGDKQLIVTVPNVQRDELVQLVGPDRRAAVPRRTRRRAGGTAGRRADRDRLAGAERGTDRVGLQRAQPHGGRSTHRRHQRGPAAHPGPVR